MIAKKNSRYDLERKRIVLFNLGLLAVGSLVLAAFTYTSPVERERQKKEVSATNITFQVDYTKPKEKIRTDQPQVQKEQPVSQQEIGSSSAITQEVSTVRNTKTNVSSEVGTLSKPGSEFSFPVEEIGGIEAPIVTFPPVEAEYIEGEGGYAGMSKFIQRSINYPDDAMLNGDEGIVYLSFVVEKDGSVSNVSIKKGVTNSLDREAKRIVRSFPTWKPAEDAHGKVRTAVSLSIRFELK